MRPPPRHPVLTDGSTALTVAGILFLAFGSVGVGVFYIFLAVVFRVIAWTQQ